MKDRTNTPADDDHTPPRSLAHTWSFDGQAWEPIPSPIPDGESWDVALERLGYSSDTSDDLWRAKLWEASATTYTTSRFGYLIELSPNLDHVSAIFVTDMPAVLTLLPLVSSLRSQDHLELLSDRIESFCTKAFRAFHGHDLDGVCRQCDPVAVQRREDARRERRQAGE